jgi:outer membrane protein assembly factor BamE (lipoprotein component of BamABCDE complex)
MFDAMIDRHSRPRYQVLRPLALGLMLATLAGCGIPVSDRGNLPKPESLDQIKPGVTDQASVKSLLGTPSTIATFDGDTWYYISRKEKQIAFLKPDVLDQEIYEIHFNDKGIVSSVVHKGMNDAQAMTPNPDATPAQGREFTFLEQLIGNFGKFNAGGGGSGGGPGSPNGGGGGP